jgi:hypothetical protein
VISVYLTREPQPPPTLVPDQPDCFNIGNFESRLPPRSSNRREDVLLLSPSRHNRHHVGLLDRPGPELDLQPVDGVNSVDLAEDHLQYAGE